jgi:hypothetical protein
MKRTLTLLALTLTLLAGLALWRVERGVRATARPALPGHPSNAAAAALACPSGNLLYVNAAVAGGTGDGSSWANAYATLAAALAQAASCNNVTEIWVAQGTYKPDTTGLADPRTGTFTLRNNLAIYGGFTSGQTLLSQRDPNPATNGTVLSGDLNGDDGANFANNGENSLHVVTGGGTDSTAILDGFTIRGGKANTGLGVCPGDCGGGLYNNNSSPTLTNLSFSGNAARIGGGLSNFNSSPTLSHVSFSGNSASQGGGLYNEISSPTLSNVTFSSNSASQGGGLYNQGNNPTLTNVSFIGNSSFGFGGGLYNSSSSPMLTNVNFSGNSAGEGGGGLHNLNSNPTLTNVSFSGNSSFNTGGGLSSINSNPTLTNVSFSGNSALQGGGLFNFSSSPTLTNVSFSGNSALQGGGMSNSFNSSPALRNCLLWGDSGGEIVNNSSTPVISHSLVQGSGGSANWDAGFGIDGGNNLDADPLFVTPVPGPAPTTLGNLRLGPGSPAINAGNNNVTNPALPATDLAGNSRTVGTVDLGAYESNYVFAISGGNNQSAIVGTAFATPLQVRLTDFSQPVSGLLVSFTAPVSGASASLANGGQASTDAQGQASVIAQANLVLGSYQITATLQGLPPVFFNLTNVCPSITLSPASLPNAAVNTAYPQTLSASPVGGNYNFAVTSGLLPNGLTLNANGSFSGAPTLAGSFNFRVTVTGFGSCTAFRDYTLLVSCPALSLSPANLAAGTVGTVYSQSVTASPAGTYSYAVTSGALPSGLTLNAANGAISGTPTTPGTFAFTVTATAGGCAVSQPYAITIGCVTLMLSNLSATAQAGVAYNQTLSVAPAGTYSFSLVQGNLPPGLGLNPSSGVLSGTATTTGSYTFTIQAAANGCTGIRQYTLTVGCPAITLNPASLAGGSVGTAYTQTLSAAPAGNYSYAVTSGSLPAGLTLSPAGSLSGTPTTSGTFNFTVTATGFGTCPGSRSYSVVISASCAAITLPALPATGTLGVNYSGNLAATTPSGSYSFSVTAGALPPGLAINNLFGQLSGKPTLAGSYSFTLTATRSNGCTGTRAYSVTVNSGAAALARFADYDGDGKADLTLWSDSTGAWQLERSSERDNPQANQEELWGTAGDRTLLGDYDGDGKTDLAVFRPSAGTWLIKRSSDGSALVKAWGVATDIPVPGDYDGDGKTDLAVFRPSDGHWYVLRSSDAQYQITAWGAGVAPYLDVPVPGDYDGDGKTDLAVFRRATGTWLIRRSSDGAYISKAWGLGSDVPVAGDYDGDGQADLAVWRGATGVWFVWRSADQTYSITAWGAVALGDVPVPGDYDGDGRSELAVWRASASNWHVLCSKDASVRIKAQGPAPARPIPANP